MATYNIYIYMVYIYINKKQHIYIYIYVPWASEEAGFFLPPGISGRVGTQRSSQAHTLMGLGEGEVSHFVGPRPLCTGRDSPSWGPRFNQEYLDAQTAR